MVSARNNVFDYLPVIKLEHISFDIYNINYDAVRTFSFDFIPRVGIHVLNGSGLTQVVNNTLYAQGQDQGILIAAAPGATEVRNNIVRGSQNGPFTSSTYFDASGMASTIDNKPGFFADHANLLVTLRAFKNDFALLFWERGGSAESSTMAVMVDQLGSPFGIECGNAQSVITHNFTRSSSPINGGIQSYNRVFEGSNIYPVYTNEDISSSQPYFTDHWSIKNYGSPELIYNDLDGSRNDIGAYGGHSYDPTGRSTTNPVILSGAVSPLYVKRGGSVTVDARAAVVAAP